MASEVISVCMERNKLNCICDSRWFYRWFLSDLDLTPATVDAAVCVRTQDQQQQHQLEQTCQPLFPIYSHPSAVIEVLPRRSPGRQQQQTTTNSARRPPLLSIVSVSPISASKSTVAENDETDIPTDVPAVVKRKSIVDALSCCRSSDACRSPASMRADLQRRRLAYGIVTLSAGVVSYIGVARSLNVMFEFNGNGDVVSESGGSRFSASLFVVYVVTLLHTFVYPVQVGIRYIKSGRKMSVRDAFRLVRRQETFKFDDPPRLYDMPDNTL